MAILAVSIPRRFLLAVAGAISLTGAACSSTPAPDPAPVGPPTSSAEPTGPAPSALATAEPAPTPTAAPSAAATVAETTPPAAPTATASASAAPQTPPGPSYVACGCGCCGGVTPRTQCLYRSKGDNLDKIIAADKAARSDARCANRGCSIGTEYRYCD